MLPWANFEYMAHWIWSHLIRPIETMSHMEIWFILATAQGQAALPIPAPLHTSLYDKPR